MFVTSSSAWLIAIMEEMLAVNRDKKMVEVIIHMTAIIRATRPFGVLSPYLEGVKMPISSPIARIIYLVQVIYIVCKKGRVPGMGL